MKVVGKEVVKQLLGEVPFTAELYWLLRQRGKPLQSRFSLRLGRQFITQHAIDAHIHFHIHSLRRRHLLKIKKHHP